MSDVLFNIIARSVAPVDAVRPTALPLFAPDPLTVEPDAGLIEQEQMISAPISRADPAAAPVSYEMPPPRAHPSVQPATFSIRHDQPQIERALPLEPERIEQNVLQPRTNLPDPGLNDPAMLDRLLQRVFGDLPEAAPHTTQPIVARIETIREPAPALPAEIAPVERGAARVTERRIEAPVAPLPMVVPRPPALPPLPEAPRGRTIEFVRETTPAAPTIQVSIGRIEVRAQPGALPQRREPARPAVMTLDEYLRRREGGAR